MKHYTTIITALILCVCILFNTNASAAALTVTPAVTPTAGRAVLVNQYTVQYLYDTQEYPIGDYNIAVYEFVITPHFNFSGDGYKTGAGIYSITVTPSTPTGWTFYAIEKSYSGFDDDYITACTYTNGQNTNTMQIALFANNVPINYNWVYAVIS